MKVLIDIILISLVNTAVQSTDEGVSDSTLTIPDRRFYPK